MHYYNQSLWGTHLPVLSELYKGLGVASLPGPGDALTEGALLCSLFLSVCVQQSLLPDFECPESWGVDGSTGEGVDEMDSERYSVPSKTPTKNIYQI